jgi:hypothetical protein
VAGRGAPNSAKWRWRWWKRSWNCYAEWVNEYDTALPLETNLRFAANFVMGRRLQK